MGGGGRAGSASGRQVGGQDQAIARQTQRSHRQGDTGLEGSTEGLDVRLVAELWQRFSRVCFLFVTGVGVGTPGELGGGVKMRGETL